MRIAMIIQRFRPAFSGQGIQVEILSQTLARRGIDVSIITAAAGPDRSVERLEGYSVVRLGADPPRIVPVSWRQRLRGAAFAARVFSFLESDRRPERQVEDETQRQGCFDGDVGILPLPAPRAPAGRFPGGDGFRGQPHGDVASADQGALVGGPVLDVILGLVLRMDPRLHVTIVRPRRPQDQPTDNRLRRDTE